ncbi:MBL fold metallo-hydrolase [Pseudobacteroides cellulosolvens]|uniref:Beta-lactamase domain protein n=1 Tax=Pseudobacteroides cellulosolvens ATCC 35603 = DSM 2933 TaxID=398512 RepID=A0A0L6JJA0_9FIRM|nr:MBL fold metallo-hydrolase [Pseudobacteroides cellulosolvens]KNY25824.1 beta-lactamase domain protein [Pseudobacteroides cellulosolvens ATCC 35603 = DSM 2933]
MIFIPIRTMKINDNVFSIRTVMVNMFVFKDGNDIICIDTGFSKLTVKYALRKFGIDPSSVSNIFLTHSDYDHAGCIKLFTDAQIHLSKDEEQMINGTTPRAMGIRYNSRIKRPYHLLQDGDIVKVGNIKVQGISTPGHTPGSMSYLINDTYLFVGDTLSLIRNKVHTFPFFINKDTKTQKYSIKKLAGINNVKAMFTAHSGYTADFQNSIYSWK